MTSQLSAAWSLTIATCRMPVPIRHTASAVRVVSVTLLQNGFAAVSVDYLLHALSSDVGHMDPILWRSATVPTCNANLRNLFELQSCTRHVHCSCTIRSMTFILCLLVPPHCRGQLTLKVDFTATSVCRWRPVAATIHWNGSTSTGR